MPLGPPGPLEPYDEACVVCVLCEPPDRMTLSPALSVPRSGVTAACVPLTRSIFTAIGTGLPVRCTKMTPLPPASVVLATPAPVCPHGEAELLAPVVLPG